MSISRNSIPTHARVIEARRGTVNAPGEPNHGRQASYEVAECYCAGVLTRWLTIRVEGEKLGAYGRSYWCKRASGRNLAKLAEGLQDIRSMIVAEVAP